jgi:hypothetical protein
LLFGNELDAWGKEKGKSKKEKLKEYRSQKPQSCRRQVKGGQDWVCLALFWLCFK